MNKLNLKQLYKKSNFHTYNFKGISKRYRFNYSIYTIITKTKNLYQKINKKSPTYRQLNKFFKEMEECKKQRIFLSAGREMVTDYLIKKLKRKNRKLK